MKKTSFTLLLTMLLCLVGNEAYADFDTSTKVVVDYLFYYLDNSNNTAQLTRDYYDYPGDIIIPSNIVYNSKQYSVTSIGDAFYGCSNLTSVKVLNPSPISVGYYTFSNRANATLYVPMGSKSAYQAAENWKEIFWYG